MFKKSRNIDLVLCIDATSSMGPCIENVRNNAKKFYEDFSQVMTNEYNSEITSLRVQVVVFRDLECDEEALEKSEFFELPEDTELFEKYLNGIVPRGGGDFKESGLEALYTAMTTEWEAKYPSDRQVIVLFTDSDAIDFGEKSKRTGYPSIVEEKTFINTWACALGNSNTMQNACKRLVMFAPAHTVYEDKIQRVLDRSHYCVVSPLKGMADISFDAIIKQLCASVSSR